MGKCIVPGCPHSTSQKYTKKLSYHVCKQIWVRVIEKATGTKIQWSRSSKICSVHFRAIYRDVNLKGKNVLKNDAVPSLFGSQCPRYDKQEKGLIKKKYTSSDECKNKTLYPLQEASSSKQVLFSMEDTSQLIEDTKTREIHENMNLSIQKEPLELDNEEDEQKEVDNGYNKCSDLVVTSLMNMIIKLFYNAEHPQNTELLSNLLGLPENADNVSDLLSKCKEEIMKNHAKMYTIFAKKLSVSHERLATMKHFMESYVEVVNDLWRKVPGIMDKQCLEALTLDDNLEGCVVEEDCRSISTTISLCTQNIMEYHAKMINCLKQTLTQEDCKKLETPSMLIEVYFTVINELWQKLAVTAKHIKTPVTEPQVKLLPERRCVLNIPATLLVPESLDNDFDSVVIEIPGHLEQETEMEVSSELEEQTQVVDDGISVLQDILESNKQLEHVNNEETCGFNFEVKESVTATAISIDEIQLSENLCDITHEELAPLQHDILIDEIIYKPWENKSLSTQFLQEISDEYSPNTLCPKQLTEGNEDHQASSLRKRSRSYLNDEEDEMLQEVKLMKFDRENDFKEIDVTCADNTFEDWQDDLVKHLDINCSKYE